MIDRSLTPIDGAIVIAFVNGCFYCRCYQTNGQNPILVGDVDIVETTDGEILQVYGIVTSICRNTLSGSLKKGKYRRICIL